MNSIVHNQQNNSKSQEEVTDYFYYEVDGVILGPIESDEFFSLIKKKKLQHETLFCIYGDSNWKKIGDVYRVANAPLLPISYISNGYAVTLAFMPFLQLGGIKILDSSFRLEINSFSNNYPTIFAVLIFIYFIITSTVVMVLDMRALEKRKIVFGRAMLLFGNIIPSYLFHRGTRIARIDGKVWNASHLLAFIWIASFSYVFNLKFHL